MQFDDDVFTFEPSAQARSIQLGLGGATHASIHGTRVFYMPGESPEAYLAYYDQFSTGGSEETPVVDRLEALRVIVSEILNKRSSEADIEGKILKVDDEQRMVYGWASVVTDKGQPVIDRQGDIILPGTLVKATNEFMEHVRIGKAMHMGEQVGVIVHSLPVTKEIGDSLGIQSDYEGWIVGYKVLDDNIWSMVKSGELTAFSIGGRATKEEI